MLPAVVVTAGCSCFYSIFCCKLLLAVLEILVLFVVLAEDAIKAALADYKLKQDPNKEEAEKKANNA